MELNGTFDRNAPGELEKVDGILPGKIGDRIHAALTNLRDNAGCGRGIFIFLCQSIGSSEAR